MVERSFPEAMRGPQALVAKVRHLLSHIRLRRFDTSTEAGRAAERHRRIALTAAATALSRAISIGATLITVPLTLHYLGNERYGMWMTIASFNAMLAFADLGIGNGVLTLVASASGKDDVIAMRAHISSAFALLGALSVAMLLALVAVYAWIDWARLFNVESALAVSEAGPALAVFLCCFALALPAAIVQRVQMGMQMGFVASLWQCLGSLFALPCLLAAIWARAGLPWLVFALVGIPLVVSILNSLVFFLRVRLDLAPRPAAVSRLAASTIGRTGALFFVLQLVGAVAFASDNLVIAQVLGASAVAHYAVPDRLFALLSMVVGFAVAPLWPAFSEALARGDEHWVRRTLIRATVLAGAVAGGGGLLLVALAPMLLYHWVGEAVTAPFLLLLGLAVWRTTEASFNAISMYLNTLRAVPFQIAIAVAAGGSAITFKLLLLPQYGIAVVPWVTFTTFMVFAGIPAILFVRIRLARAREAGTV